MPQTVVRKSAPTPVEIVDALTMDIGGLVDLSNGMTVERLTHYSYRINYKGEPIPFATALTLVDESYRHICPVGGTRCSEYKDCHNANHCWLK
jgi:hypothetical protein